VNWWNDHASLGWIAVALALGALEIATLDLVFLMLAGGALVAAVAAPLGLSLFWQVFVAIVASVAMLALIRPIALRHLHKSTPESRTGIAALIGRQALVLDRVDAHTGRVKLAGEVWSARSYDPDLVLDAGSMVDVLAIDGATAVVHATHL
jgi:membrane protein implicated in regulation of membrane protease activity